MRRKDREIIGAQALEEIILTAQVCRLGMVDNGVPYIVPLNYGYRDKTFYFHSAREGRKIEILSRGQQVCVEIDCGHELITAPQACDWGMRYASVIAYGIPRFIENSDEKRQALAIIMDQYATQEHFEFPDSALAATAIFAVDVTAMTGKRKE